MEIFNLQIRKIGDFSSLYKDIDKTLSTNNIISGGVSKNLTREAVAHALQNMIKNSSHFDVCNINSALDATNIRISSERKAIYRLAHCIDWGDMTENYRQTLIAMVMDDFRQLFLDTNSDVIKKNETN